MPSKIDYRYNLKTYIDLLQKYKGTFFFLLFLVLIVEALAVADKFLFKIIIDDGTRLSQGILPQSQFIQTLLVLAFVFMIIVLGRASCKYVNIHLINWLEGNLILDLKQKFFNHLLTLSYHFHTTHRTGSLISRLVRGGRAMETITDVIIFNMAPLLFQAAVLILTLSYFSWISAVTVLGIIIIFVGYSYYNQTQQQPYAVKANDVEDYEKGTISDYFLNIDSIKYFGKENAVKSRFGRTIEHTKQAFITHWNFSRKLDFGQTFILGGGTLAVIYFPLRQFLQADISLGTVAFIYAAYGNLIGSLFGFVRGIRDFYRVMADFESLFQYGKITNEIKDGLTAGTARIKRGNIEFNHLSFGYQKRKLFENFSLHIPKNKKVALVGPSGSGKTTLIKLLYRLYDIPEGEITIDGQNICTWKQESLRSELSIVPQECLLFDDTIYHNVAFSNPHASRRQVLQAMKFAQLDQVVRQFPHKEKTIVGERGVKLSGGEKQRVSIARAILTNKKILVLDEATSSLDSHTEHEIQQDLQKLMKGRTTIIIAHRLSTVMKADKIVVLDQGKIVQQGNHRELIGQDGLYRKLWNLQKGGYIGG